MRSSVRLGVCLALIMVLLPLPAAAKPDPAKLESLKARLRAIEAVIARHRRQLVELNRHVTVTQAALRQVVLAVSATELRLGALQDATTTADRALRATDRSLRTTRRSLARQRQQVFAWLRTVDAIGTGGFLSTLLSAESLSSFAERLALIRQIVDAEVAALGRLERQEARLRRLEAVRRATLKNLDYLRSATAGQLRLLAVQKATLQSTLSNLAQNVAVEQQALASDEGDQRAIEAAIAALASSGNGASLGSMHFIWPVSGPITSPFGWRLDPVTHQYALHTGIDIGADFGTPIRAAAGGTVILAGWVTGYGNTTIIDLGDGITTLYAHQERIAVSVGERISQGQVIGYVGATGWATGPHLHFEIRVNGKPINPLPYLP